LYFARGGAVAKYCDEYVCVCLCVRENIAGTTRVIFVGTGESRLSVCGRYTLLVGKPPFETSSIRETYVRISRNDYRVPSGLSAPARSLIHRLLHPDPQCRPSMEDVLNDQFLLSGSTSTW